MKPWLRPIAAPEDPTIVTAPADCLFSFLLQINTTTLYQPFQVKNSFTNLATMLENSGVDLNNYLGGWFTHCMLSVSDYHRFHTPLPGR